MGYRYVPTIYKLAFADREGLEVTMQGVRLGRLKKMMHADAQGEENFEEIVKFLAENLVSWNLEDPDGCPIEVGEDALWDLDVQFVLDLFGTWMDGMTGVPDDLGKGSDSGETFPVPSMSMESL